MPNALILLTSTILLGACATGDMATKDAEQSAGGQTAMAMLFAADGSPRGHVQAADTGDAIRLTITGEGLPAGSHGVHVHMTGNCTPPDFASAGGHWNPAGRAHGRNNPQGMHMGDLPNLLIGVDGQGSLEITIAGASVTGGSNPLLDADGAAMVIHAGPDDLMTDPSGNSGGRIACGVFAAG
ncbi:MAG: superoxide dismutase family protein [Alphaproteobacteria bacterium]|nr:superoxide dismutase family protein [Alphaproteobacteria bacterium]